MSDPVTRFQNMAVRLPLEQWHTVMQLLTAAPYIRVKAIVEAIETQARELDTARERERATLGHQVNVERDKAASLELQNRTMGNELARARADYDVLRSRNQRLERQAAERPRKKPPAGRKKANGAAVAEPEAAPS